MKHATTLVCIVLLVLFLDTGTNRIESLNEQNPDTVKIEINNGQKPEDTRKLEAEQQKGMLPEESEADMDVSNISLPLKGKIICLDPGHQSEMNWVKVPIAPGETFLMPDYSVGTLGAGSGVYEYSIALKVAQKLKRDLIEQGASVVLTRESDDQAVGNMERPRIASEAGADITVSLHCDGIDDPSIHGLSVLYPGEKYIRNAELLDESLKLSERILESAAASTAARNRGLSKRNSLIVFNYSKVPCTLIEMGFLTNLNEDKLLNSEAYQNKLASGITQGIINYFELSDNIDKYEKAEVKK